MNQTSNDRHLLQVGGRGAMPSARFVGARTAGLRGTGLVPCSRFAIAGDFVLPSAQTVTQLPLSVTVIREEADVTLQACGRILINVSGQYRLTLGVGWSARHDAGVDGRMVGIRRWPGSLSGRDDRLAPVDIDGFNAPFERAPLHTARELLTAGQMVYAVICSPLSGDCVEATRTTFLQIERLA